jgi:hypothetical protein
VAVANDVTGERVQGDVIKPAFRLATPTHQNGTLS